MGQRGGVHLPFLGNGWHLQSPQTRFDGWLERGDHGESFHLKQGLRYSRVEFSFYYSSADLVSVSNGGAIGSGRKITSE